MSDNLLFGIEITVGLLSYGFLWVEGISRRRPTWASTAWIRFWKLSGGTFGATVAAIGAIVAAESVSLGEPAVLIVKAFAITIVIVGLLAHISLMWWFARGDPEAERPW